MEGNLTKGINYFFQKTFLQKQFLVKDIFSGKKHFISEKVLFFLKIFHAITKCHHKKITVWA
jgi:hypothetical protein